MNIYEKFAKRLGMASRNTSDIILEDSIIGFDREFHTSPSFHQLDIDGELTDTIVHNTNKTHIKEIHFRPDHEPDVGNLVNFRGDNYLVLELDEDGIHSFGKMEKCNYTLRVQDGEAEEVYIGDSPTGEPIFELVTEYKEEPCIVRNEVYSVHRSRGEQFPLPSGRLDITIKYGDYPNVKVNEEFRLYNKNFKVLDISYIDVQDDVGVITIHVERREG